MPIQIALRGRLRVLAATLAFTGCLGPGTAAAAAALPAAGLDPQEQALCTQINAYRASKGLGRLTVSPALTRAADWMSTDMAAHDYFDHTDSRGRSTPVRIRTFGFRDATMGENLAGGNADAAATFAQWKAEPEHRRGMLRASYRVIGIGRAYAADTMLGWYWTTTFGAGGARGVAC